MHWIIKLLLTLTISFSANGSSLNKTLVLIGGGKRPPKSLKVFVQKLTNPVVFVLPWGTSYPYESFEAIKEELTVHSSTLKIKCLCEEVLFPKDLIELASAGGVYFPGGNQNKVMRRIQESKTKALFHKLYHSGVPIAGTSAGTAIQSNPMLTGRGHQTSEGLGLLKSVIVDQHFLVRNREPRLLGVLENFPSYMGLGIDEDMSAVIETSPGDKMFITAVGPSLVSIYVSDQGKFKRTQIQDGETVLLP